MESGDFSDIDSYLPESGLKTLNNILKEIGDDRQREEGRRLRIRGRAREGIHVVADKTVEGKSLRYRKNEDILFEGTGGTDGKGEILFCEL